MSGGVACKNKSHRLYWRVSQRRCHHSAFSGYHWTSSDYSEMVCTARGCGKRWRTRAAYVNDHDDEGREP